MRPQIDSTDVNCFKTILRSVVVDKPVIFEIGSWLGDSLSILADFARFKKGKVTAIDNFKGTGSVLEEEAAGMDVKAELINRLTTKGLIEYVEIWDGESDIFVDNVVDGSIDYMFIDGDHRYDQVKRDIDNYWPKVRGGGIMSGHDFDKVEFDESLINTDSHDGVTKAVREKFKKFNLCGRIWWVVK